MPILTIGPRRNEAGDGDQKERGQETVMTCNRKKKNRNKRPVCR